MGLAFPGWPDGERAHVLEPHHPHTGTSDKSTGQKRPRLEGAFQNQAVLAPPQLTLFTDEKTEA